MKKTLLALALLALLPAAHATRGANSNQHQDQEQRQNQRQFQSSESTSGSESRASGGSATAAGVGGDSGASLNDNSSSSSRALGLFLPPPVHTPPLPKIDCPSANVEQSSMSVGWSAYSQAKGSINSDNCALFSGYNAYLAACQYRSAKGLLDLTMQRIVPGFKPSDMDLIDYTPEQCRVLTAPLPAPAREVTIFAAPVVAPAAVAPKSKPGKAPKSRQVVATSGRFGNRDFDCTAVCRPTK